MSVLRKAEKEGDYRIIGEPGRSPDGAAVGLRGPRRRAFGARHGGLAGRARA